MAGAHPRSRGEHREVGAVRLDELGSSPLARGTRTRSNLVGSVHRLIPARAGNTARRWPLTTSPSAHPRSHGEHVH